MRHYLSKLLSLLAVMLIASTGFHGIAVASHPAPCPEEHEHAGAESEAPSMAGIEGAAGVLATDHAPQHDEQDGAGVCHAHMIGCGELLAKEEAGSSAPSRRQVAFSLASAIPSSIRLAAAHRPPILGA